MLVRLEEPRLRKPPASGGWAPFALGFRPFYLLAAAFAVLAIPYWVLVWQGKAQTPLPGVWWHAHEMLFGFAAAAIVGFLFTAGRNWTGLSTPTGWPLAALALVWLFGRWAMLADDGGWPALFNAGFLGLAALALARILWRRGQSWRNYFVPALLAGLALANLCFHLGRLGIVAVDPMRSLHAALGLVVLLETIIAGRVTPSFTAAAVKGVRQWRHPLLDAATLAATGIALAVWVVVPAAPFAPVAYVAAAGLHLLRAGGWNPWAARGMPLLWILHLANLWIPLGFLLLAATAAGALSGSAAVHAFGIGATGGLILGMITRTALGHTGRALKVGAGETAAYAAILLAALARVGTQTFLPQAAALGIHLAAALWTVAFALYLIRYAPWLLRPRADGQPG